MKRLAIIISLIAFMSCNSTHVQKRKPVQLVTLDPGHFHAALVQKTMYDDVDSVVNVYAPAGNDLQFHLDRIKGYNSRSENPTRWKEEVYSGDDFFQQMISQKKGNVVVLAGNNEKKAGYILNSLQNGFHVLADKPMAITEQGFEKLKRAFDVAQKNNLLLYDIMTERFEITTVLQRELSMMPEIFGTLEQGTAKDPAVVKDGIHFFYKYISGNVVTRPPWFFDASQQGEGIADVMTHMVDLVQWECFPGQSIDYTKDIRVDSANHWTTDLGLSEFRTLTNLSKFPAYLLKNVVRDTVLKVLSNGTINYMIRGVHAKTTVVWNYKSGTGSGDTYYSLMKGTKANLVIRQGAEENYQPVLYVEPAPSYKTINITGYFKKLQEKYPGIELKPSKTGWQVIIPDKYKEGHEAHFARVTQNFLEYLKNKNMPAWEIPGMLAKYYTTTRAVELAGKK